VELGRFSLLLELFVDILLPFLKSVANTLFNLKQRDENLQKNGTCKKQQRT
jgi:hypothetical protein